MAKFIVTVYQSYTYEIETDIEEEASRWLNCPESTYEFINDNGIEPLDFGTDDVTIEQITSEV